MYFLTSALVGGGVVSFTPRPFYSKAKDTRYPYDRKPGGPQSRSGRLLRRDKSLAPAGNRTPIGLPQLHAVFKCPQLQGAV
jgi:hypothetical protein